MNPKTKQIILKLFLCLSFLQYGFCDMVEGPSQLQVVMFANSRELDFQLKDRTNISVIIKPTKTFLVIPKDRESSNWTDSERFKDELVVPKVISYYDYDRRVVMILEKFLESHYHTLDSTIHGLIYRYIYTWYKRIEDPEVPEPMTSYDVNSVVTKLPKTIGFADLTIRIIQRIVHDLPIIVGWSKDSMWIEEIVKKIEEAETICGDIFNEHKVTLITSSNNVLIKTYNIHPLELYSGDIEEDIRISDLVSSASLALSKRYFSVALEWLKAAEDILNNGTINLRNQIQEQNLKLKRNKKYLNDHFYDTDLTEMRNKFESSRKLLVEPKLQRLSKMAPDLSNEPVSTTNNNYFASKYLEMLLNTTAMYHDQLSASPIYKDIYGLYSKPLHKEDLATQSSKEWKEKKIRIDDLPTDTENLLARHEILCKGIDLRTHKERARYSCRYDNRGSSFLTIMPFKVEELNNYPEILMFHDLVNDKWIEELQTIALTTQNTALTFNADLETIIMAQIRKSYTSWVSDSMSPKVLQTSRLISHLTGMNTENIAFEDAESFQMNVYGSGGFYARHKDAFGVYENLKEEDPGYNKTLELIEFHKRGDRIATVMIYLNDDFIGGRTVFPTLGLSVEPLKGSAVYWPNLQRSGKINHLTIHAGCPVLAGTKWVTNKWIRSNAQMFRKPCSLNEIDDLYKKFTGSIDTSY